MKSEIYHEKMSRMSSHSKSGEPHPLYTVTFSPSVRAPHLIISLTIGELWSRKCKLADDAISVYDCEVVAIVKTQITLLLSHCQADSK